MALTTLSNVNAAGTAALNTFIRDIVIDQFQQNTRFKGLGRVVNLPMGSYTYQFDIVSDTGLTLANTTITEGNTPNAKAFAMSRVTVTTEERMAHHVLTEKMLRQGQHKLDVFEIAGRELGRGMANVFDKYIQSKINDGTNVIYATGSARGSVGTGNNITEDMVHQGMTTLAGNSAPKLEQEKYVMVIHPNIAYNLRSETAGFIDFAKYNAQEKIFNGEIGSMWGVKVVVSDNVDFFAGEGSSGANVYPCYMMGEEAFGVVLGKDLTTGIVMPTRSESDPHAQRGNVAAEFDLGADILKQESLVRLEVGASYEG